MRDKSLMSIMPGPFELGWRAAWRPTIWEAKPHASSCIVGKWTCGASPVAQGNQTRRRTSRLSTSAYYVTCENFLLHKLKLHAKVREGGRASLTLAYSGASSSNVSWHSPGSLVAFILPCPLDLKIPSCRCPCECCFVPFNRKRQVCDLESRLLI